MLQLITSRTVGTPEVSEAIIGGFVSPGNVLHYSPGAAVAYHN